MRTHIAWVSAVVMSSLLVSGCNNQDDLLRRVGAAANQMAANGQLSEQEIVAGLKEALQVGTERSVDLLGRKDGYMGDLSVRILMPESLRGLERTMRDLGQGKVVDEFITSMNRAAEKAAPEAVDIFVDVIKGMSLADARNILKGPDDAATRYFRQHSETRLKQSLHPVIAQATANVGVTASYKNLMGRAGPLTALIDKQAVDLDGYITARALDGLFLKLAAEEKRIRENPVARTTELLRKVFANKG